MPKLIIPKQVISLYKYNETPIFLGDIKSINLKFNQYTESDEVNIFIPYREGMDIEQISKSIKPLGPDDNVFFYFDSLKVQDNTGENYLVAPDGICIEWFLKNDTDIIEHDNKFVFLNSCPHTWDGIDNVSLLTIDTNNNIWTQQSWNEAGFIKDCLIKYFNLDSSDVENWGNDSITLKISSSGDKLYITSGIEGKSRHNIPCLWIDDHWVINQHEIILANPNITISDAKLSIEEILHYCNKLDEKDKLRIAEILTGSSK